MTEPTNGNGTHGNGKGLGSIVQAAQSVSWIVVVLGGGLYGQTSLDRTAQIEAKLISLEEAVHEYHREDEIAREVERRLAEMRENEQPRPEGRP
ncbi:MAG: hypothetical protein AAF211_12675 [Myxococcota bacterium]